MHPVYPAPRPQQVSLPGARGSAPHVDTTHGPLAADDDSAPRGVIPVGVVSGLYPSNRGNCCVQSVASPSLSELPRSPKNGMPRCGGASRYPAGHCPKPSRSFSDPGGLPGRQLSYLVATLTPASGGWRLNCRKGSPACQLKGIACPPSKGAAQSDPCCLWHLVGGKWGYHHDGGGDRRHDPGVVED